MLNLKRSAASFLSLVFMLACVAALLFGVQSVNKAAEEDTLMNAHIASCDWCSQEWTALVDCPVAARVYSDRFHLSDSYVEYMRDKALKVRSPAQ